MFILVRKLRAVKQKLKGFNGNNFAGLQHRIEESAQKAEFFSNQALAVPNCTEHQVQAKLWKDKFLELENATELLMRQQSKVRWIKEGDSNTSYFHAQIKQRRAANMITSIVNNHGQITYDMDQIKHDFLDYYVGLLGTAPPDIEPLPDGILQSGYVLSAEQKECLCIPVLEEEIKLALFSIDKTNAPGPDGFSSGFYKASWQLVGETVTNSILDFFNLGKLLTQVNSTNICLVPKITNPSKPGDFRPIACCNVVYKTITKIIANRLLHVLDDLISLNQSAFVNDRLISSNILVFQDLVRGYHRNSGPPRCLMKIDLRKAYDYVAWSFIKQVLDGFGFPPLFTHWIIVCVTTAQYSVLINGTSFGFLKGKRGIRQEDPLSPYLFVLVMEGLSRLLNQAGLHSEFSFHHRCEV